jgi:hypothetical protein
MMPVTVMIAVKAPYKSIDDVIGAAKAKPGEMTFSTTGNGTVGHLTGELLQRRAGIKLIDVPYREMGTDREGGRRKGAVRDQCRVSRDEWRYLEVLHLPFLACRAALAVQFAFLRARNCVTSRQPSRLVTPPRTAPASMLPNTSS